MNIYELKIEEYNSAAPGEFPVVEWLKLVQTDIETDKPPELSLELSLKPFVKRDHRRFYIIFHDVRNLLLQQPQLSLFQVCKFDIRRFAEPQWEYTGYSVKDIEEKCISFLCQDFDFCLNPVWGGK